MSEDVREIKHALENLNTRKSSLRRIITGISCRKTQKIVNFSVRGAFDAINLSRPTVVSVICYS